MTETFMDTLHVPTYLNLRSIKCSELQFMSTPIASSSCLAIITSRPMISFIIGRDELPKKSYRFSGSLDWPMKKKIEIVICTELYLNGSYNDFLVACGSVYTQPRWMTVLKRKSAFKIVLLACLEDISLKTWSTQNEPLPRWGTLDRIEAQTSVKFFTKKITTKIHHTILVWALQARKYIFYFTKEIFFWFLHEIKVLLILLKTEAFCEENAFVEKYFLWNFQQEMFLLKFTILP